MFGLSAAIISLWLPSERKRKRLGQILGFYSRAGLRVLNIRVAVKGKWSQSSGLYVCNHVSYLDILILSSSIPVCYVTSIEVRDMPVLGFLSRLANCLYVERRSKQNLGLEVSEITQALKEGTDVVVFPEATSTNGDTVLRFRSPLFSAATGSGKPVYPLCLRYVRINGEKFNVGNRDLVCWYGDMKFLNHLWSVAKCRDIFVDLHVLDSTQNTQAYANIELANKSYDSVYQCYTATI